jgi:hypothetical protein
VHAEKAPKGNKVRLEVPGRFVAGDYRHAFPAASIMAQPGLVFLPVMWDARRARHALATRRLADEARSGAGMR